MQTYGLNFVITKASHNKQTNELRWFAVASDTLPDSYSDSMTLELFKSFIQRAESQEPVPMTYRSKFWQGGMPYLSLAHYSDQDGKAVVGVVDKLYIDGNRLKASGHFSDNPLGWAAYRAISKDLYEEHDADHLPIRISIGFLDYAHLHPENGKPFVRKEDAVCVDCAKSHSGKIFLDGHLIHLALTRVPVNQRTAMNVVEIEEMSDIKSKKDDAASIVGEELAEQVAQAEPEFAGKSMFVVKSDDKDEDDVEGDTDEEEMDEEKAGAHKKGKKKMMYSLTAEEIATIVKSAVSEVKPSETPKAEHPLDKALETFKSAYDTVAGTTRDLKELQPAFNALGENIIKSFTPQETAPVQPQVQEVAQDLVSALKQALAEANAPVLQELSILNQRLTQPAQAVEKSVPVMPTRRSIVPNLAAGVPQQTAQPAGLPGDAPGSLRDLVRRSVSGK